MVYNTNASISGVGANGIGFYYWNGTHWVNLMVYSHYVSDTTNNWRTVGNSGTNANVHFIGTTDNQPLRFKIRDQLAGFIDSASYSTSLGYRSTSLPYLGSGNSSFGYFALANDRSGANTSVGAFSMVNNTTSYGNTAIGNAALFAQTYSNSNNLYLTGNVAIGNYALENNNPTSVNNGNKNTAVGYRSLTRNTIGHSLVSIGFELW